MPTFSLKNDASSRDEFSECLLMAFGTIGKRGIGYFLYSLETVVTSVAGIIVGGHGGQISITPAVVCGFWEGSTKVQQNAAEGG